MRGGKLVYDGLWRCLCPAFDRKALFQAVTSPRVDLFPRATRLTRTIPSNSGFRPAVIPAQSRRYATDAAAIHQVSTATSADRAQRISSWEERLLAPDAPDESTLKTTSVDEIISALMTLRDPRDWTFHGQEIDRHERIQQLVQHLLSDVHQPLNPFVYECMMDAMVDPQGSAQGVRKLLADAAAVNIKPTAAMCQSALQALAVHPDYVLRQEIIDIMNESWFVVDVQAKQSILLGLLRDQQYELAYTRLMESIEQGSRLELWVYDIFIMVFGRLGFIDEMLTILYRRKRIWGTDDAVNSLLYFALDVSSQAYHHAGTAFGWNSVVRNALLQPSDGTIENVLGTAARHGDTELATEALDMLSSRTRVKEHHYEAVAEAFCRSGDMSGTLHTLKVMRRNGMVISRSRTSFLHEALMDRPEVMEEAEVALKKMRREDVVSQAIVAVLLETKSQAHGSKAAMDLYNIVEELTGEPAQPELLHTLIINSQDDETARIFAQAYKDAVPDESQPVAMNYTPERYRALISTCARIHEMDLAFRFAGELMAHMRSSKEASAGQGAARRRTAKIETKQLGWLKPLALAAFASEDGRIWPLVDELRTRADGEAAEMMEKMLRRMRIARKTSGTVGEKGVVV